MQILIDELESLIVHTVGECDFPLLGGRGVREYVCKIAAQAELVTWVDQGRLVAFLALYANDAAGKEAFISMVIVARAYRGRGVASGLVTAVIFLLKARGFARCRLQVHQNNAAALRMYERLAFLRVEEAGEFIVMERPL